MPAPHLSFSPLSIYFLITVTGGGDVEESDVTTHRRVLSEHVAGDWGLH